MTSILIERDEATQLRGVVWMARIFFAVAFLICVYGVLLATSRIAFTQAAWLVGIRAAQMGPPVFATGAIVYVACGVGLLRRWRWARWLAIVLFASGLAQQVPSVSAAVTEFHWLALGREGCLFIARVVCLRYLLQSSVRESFER